jgi:hypothetical protein
MIIAMLKRVPLDGGVQLIPNSEVKKASFCAEGCG